MKCIRCGRKKAVKALGGGMFRCGACGALFDSDPDEGGTHGTDPAARMEREERHRENRRRRVER